MGEGTAKGFRRRSFFGRLAGGLLAALGLGASRRESGAAIHLFPEPAHRPVRTGSTWSWK